MGAQAVRLSNVDIDNALKNKDFEVLFQPVFDLENGALARVESFVRWRHPSLGLLPPGAFISFFESQGRMSELTRYVLGNAISAYSSWRGPFAPGLSVNLALSDLTDDAFTSHFVKLLRDHEFPAELITLECPMPSVEMPLDKASEHFQRLADTGARLAIEVRGRANEMLRSLDPFPFDEIKTGGSAILRFARTVRGPGLSAIADLLDVASEANAAITAVGVEDQTSLTALRGLGFTAAQGNHLAKVGDLKDFRPHRINEVRAMLDLDPLSPDNIAALFRTEAPSIPTTEAVEEEKPDTEPETGTEDALIQRLNERVAEFDAAASSEPPARQTDENPAPDAAAQESEEDKKAKAREKAKAHMLAKRAKVRAERKAAAIERAKLKAADKPDEAGYSSETEEPASSEPRVLQERLNQAFQAEEQEETPAPMPSAAAPDANADEEQKTPESAEPAGVKGSPFVFDQNDLGLPQQKPSLGVPEEKSQPVRESAFPGGMSKPVSLSVGSTSAYFQPGIRVGAPALPGDHGNPETPVEPSALHLPPTGGVTEENASPVSAESDTPEDEFDEPTSGNAQTSTVERAMAAYGPADSVHSDSVPADDGNVEDIEGTESVIGDLHNDAEQVKAPAHTVRKRKQKHILARKYQFQLPNHFWPKSWKRALKRRQAAIDAERAARGAEQDQPQVAAE